MNPSGPGGFIDRFLGAALTFLLAAGALYLGIQLLLDVWLYLVLVSVLVLAVTLGIVAWRNSRRGW